MPNATAPVTKQPRQNRFPNSSPIYFATPIRGKGELTARQLLDTGRKRLDEDRNISPEVRTRVLENIAKAYRSLGPNPR